MPRRSQRQTAVEERDQIKLPPIWVDNDEIHEVAVERTDPPEGYLGTLEPEQTTEEGIRQRWGGGAFRLRARDASSQYVKNVPVVRLTVAGDPLFQSESFRRRWARSQGIALGDDRADQGAPARGERAPTITEMMMLMNAMGEKARAEAREQAQQREREQQMAFDRQLQLQQQQIAAREKELASERERMREEQRSERERNREFMSTMVSVLKEKQREDPAGAVMGALLQGVKLARGLGGGDKDAGPGDPVTALMNNLPEVLSQTNRLIEKGHGQQQQRQNPPQVEEYDDDDQGDDEDDPLVLDGELADEGKQLVEALIAQGKDPEKFLKGLLASGRRLVEAKPAPGRAAGSSSASAPGSSSASTPGSSSASTPGSSSASTPGSAPGSSSVAVVPLKPPTPAAPPPPAARRARPTRTARAPAAARRPTPRPAKSPPRPKGG